MVTRLYDEVTRDKNPCLTAQQKPAPTSTSTGKVEEAKPEEMEEMKKKGGVGDLLKGLTGK